MARAPSNSVSAGVYLGFDDSLRCNSCAPVASRFSTGFRQMMGQLGFLCCSFLLSFLAVGASRLDGGVAALVAVSAMRLTSPFPLV